MKSFNRHITNNQMFKYIGFGVFVFFGLILLGSCKKKSPDEGIDISEQQMPTKEEVGIYIYPEESHPWAQVNFLSLPATPAYNVNRLRDTLNYWVFSKPNRAKKVTVKPIAAIEIKDQGKAQTIILAIPKDDQYRNILCDDFQKWNVDCFPAKVITEYWITNHKGLGKVYIDKWHPEGYAQNFIDNFLSKVPEPAAKN